MVSPPKEPADQDPTDSLHVPHPHFAPIDELGEEEDLSTAAIEIVSDAPSFELPDCIKRSSPVVPPVLSDSNSSDHVASEIANEKNFGLHLGNELREPPILNADQSDPIPPVFEESLSSPPLFSEIKEKDRIEDDPSLTGMEFDERPLYRRPLVAILLGLLVSLLFSLLVLLLREDTPKKEEMAKIPSSIAQDAGNPDPEIKSESEEKTDMPKPDPPKEEPKTIEEEKKAPEKKTEIPDSMPVEKEKNDSLSDPKVPVSSTIPEGKKDSDPKSADPPSTEVKSEEKEMAENEADEKKEFVETTLTTQTTIQKILPTLKKEIPPVDLETGLKTPVKKIDFSGSKLSDVFRTLSGISGVPVGFDLSCFELMRGAAASTVDLHLESTTVGDILVKIAALLHLEIRKENNAISLTLPDSEKNVFGKKEYQIDGLLDAPASGKINVRNEDGILSSPLSANELSLMIEELIDPLSWKKNGGKGTILIANKKMEIEQTPLNHRRIALLLDHLRQFRQLDGKNNFSKEDLVPELFGWETLSAPLSLNYLEPVPLLNVILLLEQSKSLRIFVDESALRQEGIDLNTPVMVRINKGTIDQAFNALLTPLHLTYIILGKESILITSIEIAESYKTLEPHLYRLPDKSKKNETDLDILIQKLQKENAPSSWSDRKKPDPKKACFILDSESGFLLIRQSQPNQRMIHQWLDRLREGN